jgi:V/A-type H+-transporting ATPase subunit A
MQSRSGTVVRVNGNMVGARFSTHAVQNEVAFVLHGSERLKAEVIRIKGDVAEMQVYESTSGITVGDGVDFTGELLSVELGPGLLGQIFDGLQNPLPILAAEQGFFLKRGEYRSALSGSARWEFTPCLQRGARLRPGEKIGTVPEKIFTHFVMCPFFLPGPLEVTSIVAAGAYDSATPVARVRDCNGKEHDVFLNQTWPVKIPIRAYAEKLKPTTPLVTKMRLIDSLFPVAKGGTYCIPGPFGAGKTVLQQLTSRHAEVDIVIIAACGERAGEVVRQDRYYL